MTDVGTVFSDDVDAARDRFLAQCSRTGLRVTAYPAGAGKGPRLFCDVARLGSPDAPAAVVLCGNASGAAGFVPAGICCGLLAHGLQRNLPRDVALLLVHAVNPGGPVWPPRARPPARAELGPIDGDNPPAWNDELLAAAENRYAAFLREAQRSAEGTKSAADDVPAAHRNSPGSASAWPEETLRAIAERHLAAPRHIVLLDFRTGPSPWGETAVMAAGERGSPGLQRAQRWFGGVMTGADEAAGRAPVAGGLAGLVEHAEATAVLIEFGSYPMSGMLGTGALGAALSGIGAPGGAAGDARRPAAYPSADDWRLRVWGQARDIVTRAISGADELAKSWPERLNRRAFDLSR